MDKKYKAGDLITIRLNASGASTVNYWDYQLGEITLHSTTPTPPAGQIEAVEQAIGKTLCPEVLARANSGVWDMKGGTKLRRAAEAAIAASGAEHIAGWQDISTAPRDGTYVDIWIPHNICERYTDAYYSENANAWCWNVEGTGQRVVFTKTPPTHWMPLPLPPELREK